MEKRGLSTVPSRQQGTGDQIQLMHRSSLQQTFGEGIPDEQTCMPIWMWTGDTVRLLLFCEGILSIREMSWVV